MNVILKDNRLRPIIWMFAAACAQVIAFWYPYYVAHEYPSSDGDGRYFILPELVFGAGLLGLVCLFLLMYRLRGHSRSGNAAALLSVSIFAVIVLFPVVRLILR